MKLAAGNAILEDRYRVDAVLHEGPRSVVVAATHLVHQFKVAIKIMQPSDDPVATKRFMRAAREASRLRGEHAVRIADLGFLDGRPYLVMELLEGPDLAAMVAKGGPLQPAPAVDLLLQLCEGLAEMHANQLVHRDIAPSNLVVVREQGQPCLKIIDFHFVRAPVPPGQQQPAPGDEIIGTPPYASPEQLSYAGTDARADLWAVGAVACTIVAGQPPFTAPSFAELVADIHEGSRPTLPASIPPQLAAAIARCLEHAPDARYQTVVELAAALAPCAGDPARAARSVERCRALLAG
jgi:serine/threonine protein kinase